VLLLLFVLLAVTSVDRKSPISKVAAPSPSPSSTTLSASTTLSSIKGAVTTAVGVRMVAAVVVTVVLQLGGR
jgi:hypothetical protein